MKSLRLDLSNIRGHLKELDGLRGMAIASVLVFHLFPFLPLAKLGWVGVDLFFVLSGFLITGILLESVEERNYWKNFIIRRVLRIFPLYYFVLLLFVIISSFSKEFASLPVVQYEYFVENQAWYWLYASNIKIFLEGQWLPTIVFNPFWSLSIEEQFYIFWPLVVYSIRGRKLILTILISVVAIFILRSVMIRLEYSHLSLYVFTFSRLDAILLGSLIAAMLRIENLRKFLEEYAVTIFISTLVILVAVALIRKSFNPYLYDLQLYGYTLIALCFGSLLLMVLNKKDNFRILKSFFRSKILLFLGKYSYSLYIFHWALYRLLNDPLKQSFSHLSKNQLILDLTSSFTILAITIACSLATWNLFEKHFIGLKSILAPSQSHKK